MASDEQIDRSLTTLQRTLNLSPSQVTNARQLIQSHRSDLKSTREQTRSKWEGLMTMLNQPNPDPAAVGRAAMDLKAAHDQARAKRDELETQFTKLLNPTQQRIVNNLRDQAETFVALRRLGLLEGRSPTMLSQNSETEE